MTEVLSITEASRTRGGGDVVKQPGLLLSTTSEVNEAAAAWTQRQLNPWRSKAIEEFAGSSFLDVGCGNGQYVLHFQDRYSTAGLDIQAYSQWAESPERFQTGDAARLPFADSSFDTVVSFETLEHVPDPSAVLREFHRVCRRNIIISVPNCELPSALEQSRLTFFHFTDRSHVNFFDRKSLAATLDQNGFNPCHVDLINPCPLRPFLKLLIPGPERLIRLLSRVMQSRAPKMTILAVADRKASC